MQKSYVSFLATLEPKNAAFIKSYSGIGDEDYSKCTVDTIKNVLIKVKPTSPRTITTICYFMTLYARYLNNPEMEIAIKGIDRNEVWDAIKEDVPPKFITHAKYEEVCKSVDMFEEHNSFYKRVLFQCIYEGIYNDDLSVIKNLRASDVQGNIVTLRSDDGKVRQMEIPEMLAKDLKQLGTFDTWERKHRYGTCNVPVVGQYPDTCFKVEIRQGGKPTQYKHVFYRLLRNLSNEYVEYPLGPNCLYASGLMYRICKNLEAAGFDAEKAFREHNWNSNVANIIDNELSRCGCESTIRTFKEFVRGHWDIFFDRI